jgi:prepilin-type N-terminal cleavage/methylation domain-containing protein
VRTRTKQAAFSLVELIATLAVIAILAAFAVPRFTDRTGFASRGVYDQGQAVIRSAQKIAIAQRQSPPKTPVYVVITAAQIRVCYDAACAATVTDAATGAALAASAPTGVTFAPVTTFSYSGSGVPSMGAQLAVNVNSTGVGDVNRTFFVEAQTGYVHE